MENIVIKNRVNDNNSIAVIITLILLLIKLSNRYLYNKTNRNIQLYAIVVSILHVSLPSLQL